MRKQKSSKKLKELDDLFIRASEEKNNKKQMVLVKKAREFAKHENILLGKWKDKFCNKCNSWFKGKNVKIRLSKRKISRECLNCHHIYRKKFK